MPGIVAVAAAVNGSTPEMKLAQLRYVIAIADEGLNMTTAADRLHTSQPVLSKQLKQLETELGARIFVRYGKKLIRITTLGQQVIARARFIVREADSIRALCQRLGETGPVLQTEACQAPVVANYRPAGGGRFIPIGRAGGQPVSNPSSSTRSASTASVLEKTTAE